MTKQEEMAVLDAAFKKLGRDSYLGPWLSEVRADVERTIITDLTPSPLPSSARREANDILADAQREADRIIETAKKTAGCVKATGEADAGAARLMARAALKAALDKLGG